MKTLESIIWLTNAKPFFLGKRDKPWNSSKTLSLYWSFLWICFEVCQTLHQIFWEIEYWFKSLGCQIRSTNTKPFFWKSEVKLQTLQNLSPYIDVCRKFVLNLAKIINRISWAMEYWFKAWECRIWLTNTKPFSGNAGQTLDRFRNFLLILALPINLFWSVLKPESECSGPWNIGSSL